MLRLSDKRKKKSSGVFRHHKLAVKQEKYNEFLTWRTSNIV